MKVSLLRNTMIAGTPKSAGSIVEVEQHIGDMLIGIGKAEAVVKACKAPIAKPKTEKRMKKESNLGSMTKAELETYGRTIGLELDKRLNKTTLLTQIEEATKQIEVN
tara:strand:+ start:322 stop:642 length:321 start_codon:yes stop_codon:yes gene_type:complete